MIRPALCLLAALPLAAQAQSRGCIERPVGPGMDIAAVVPLPGRARHGAGVAVTLPAQPLQGTGCVAAAPAPRDILRGAPPPAGGLLRGDDGRADLLRDPAPTRAPTGWAR